MAKHTNYYASTMKLNEWSYAPSPYMNEADEEPNTTDDMNGDMPPQGGQDTNAMGQTGPMDSNMPPQNPNDGNMPPQEGQDSNAMGQADTMDGNMPPQGADDMDMPEDDGMNVIS